MNDLRVDGAIAPTSTRATSGSLRPERSSQGEVSSDATPQIASPTEKHRALDANARSHEILRALQSNGKSPQKTPSNASDRAAHAVARPKSAFVATVQKNFVKWDTDKDGRLTDPEIDRACEDPTNRGNAAAALDVLERDDDDPSFKGFGAAELRAAEAKFKKGDTSCDALMAYYTSRIDEYHKQSELYGASGHPSISDIHQSGEGDCFFLAALGAKVKRDPASVERMIAPHDDGSYTVSFAKEDVHVAPLTDAELGRAASSGGNGRWVAVMERAYADYKTRQDASKEDDPYDAFNGGGLIERAMGDMGATNVQSFNFAGTNPNKLPSLDGFRGHLQGFLADQKDVCAISWESPDRLPTGHAYTVTGFDAMHDTVSVRNPWGTVGAGYNTQTIADKGSGLFEMKVDDFLKNFSDIVVGDPPAPLTAVG